MCLSGELLSVKCNVVESSLRTVKVQLFFTAVKRDVVLEFTAARLTGD